MNNQRLNVYLLAFVMLFCFGGCTKKPQKTKFHQLPVDISDCKATPDPVAVIQGDKIDWEASDGQDYTISFADQTQPTPNPFKVHHGVSNPAHPIMGHKGCTPKNGGYYCKYSLTKDNQSTPCADPGVYIK